MGTLVDLRQSLFPVAYLALVHFFLSVVGLSLLKFHTMPTWALGFLFYFIQFIQAVNSLWKIVEFNCENIDGPALVEFFERNPSFLIFRIVSNVWQIIILAVVMHFPELYLLADLDLVEQRTVLFFGSLAVLFDLVSAVKTLGTVSVVNYANDLRMCGITLLEFIPYLGIQSVEQLGRLINLIQMSMMATLVALSFKLRLEALYFEVGIVAAAALLQFYRWLRQGRDGGRPLLLVCYTLYLLRLLSVGYLFFLPNKTA